MCWHWVTISNHKIIFANNNFDGNLICVDRQTGHPFLHVSFVQNKINVYFIIDFNSIIQYKDELPYY